MKVQPVEKAWAADAARITGVSTEDIRTILKVDALTEVLRSGTGTVRSRAIFPLVPCANLHVVGILHRLHIPFVVADALSRSVYPNLAYKALNYAGAYSSKKSFLPHENGEISRLERIDIPGSGYYELFLSATEYVSKNIRANVSILDDKAFAVFRGMISVSIAAAEYFDDTEELMNIRSEGGSIILDLDAMSAGMVERATNGFFEISGT